MTSQYQGQPVSATQPRSFDSDLERPSHPSTSTPNSIRFGAQLAVLDGIMLRPANSSNNSQPQHSHSSATMGSKAMGGPGYEEDAIFNSYSPKDGDSTAGIVGGHRQSQSRLTSESPSHGSLAQLLRPQAAPQGASANNTPLLYMTPTGVLSSAPQKVSYPAGNPLPSYYASGILLQSPTGQGSAPYNVMNATHLVAGPQQLPPPNVRHGSYPSNQQGVPGLSEHSPVADHNNSSFCSSSPAPTSNEGHLSYNSSYQTLQGSFAVDTRNRLLLPTSTTTTVNPQGQGYGFTTMYPPTSPHMVHNPLSSISLVSMQPQVSPSSTFMVSSSHQGLQPEGAMTGPPLLQAVGASQQQPQYPPFVSSLPPQRYVPHQPPPSSFTTNQLLPPAAMPRYTHQPLYYTQEQVGPSPTAATQFPINPPSFFASQMPSPAPMSNAPPAAGNRDNLYVSGLPMECRDADLTGLFESVIGIIWPSGGTDGAPKILSGSVRMNINTGVSRGFGFVKVSSEEAAATLLAHMDNSVVGMLEAVVTTRDAAAGAVIGMPARRRVLRVIRGGSPNEMGQIELSKNTQVDQSTLEDGRRVQIETRIESSSPLTPTATSRLHIVFAQSVADYNPAALMPKVFARNLPATVTFANAEALFSKHEGYTSMIYQRGTAAKGKPATGTSDPLGMYQPEAARSAADDPNRIVLEPRLVGLYGFYNVYATYSTVEHAVLAAHDLHNTRASMPLDQLLAALLTRLQQLLPLLMRGSHNEVSHFASPVHPLFVTQCFENTISAFALSASLPVGSTQAAIMGHLRSLLEQAANAAPMITSANAPSPSPSTPQTEADSELLLKFLTLCGHKVLLEATYMACRGDISYILTSLGASHPPSTIAVVKSYFEERNFQQPTQSNSSVSEQPYSSALLSEIIPLITFGSASGEVALLEPIPILAKVAEDIEFRRKRLEAKTRGAPTSGPQSGGYQNAMGRGGGAFGYNKAKGGGRGGNRSQYWPQQSNGYPQTAYY